MGVIASVVGATGLVGRDLVSLLCDDAEIDAVHILGRRVMPDFRYINNPNLNQHVIDFDRLADSPWPHCDVLFCCLGTTIKAAGSRDAFRIVDVDYVVGSAYRA
jgi:aspartate-semialdehyde dehydrogenase